jgi:predicted nucleic acid-binding protein
LEEVEVIDFEESDHPSLSLSRSDRASLAWAKRNRPHWLLADERLLRRVASSEGLSVIGTLGLLFQAARSDVISREELRIDIHGLVGEHRFRISIDLYQKILDEIESL